MILDHIGVNVRDFAASKAFYEEALAPPGLRPQYHPNDYGAFVFYPDGNNLEAVRHHAE